MNQFHKTVFVSTLFMVFQIVYMIDPDQYCDLQKYCTADGSATSSLHIGCKNNFNRFTSNYKFVKLRYNDRSFIVNELNQFRSDVALGEIYANKLSPLTFSYMKKLKWDFELDHLLQLMITKHSNSNFYCMSTAKDHKPIQLVISVKRPQPFSLEKVFSLAIDELKIKALQSYNLAGRNETINWSQCYHPETWAFACAVGELKISSNDKDILIRCAFYGKKFKKTNEEFKYGELCSGCGKEGCSDLFPGLCGSDWYSKRGPNGIDGPVGVVGEPGSKGLKGEKGTYGNESIIGASGLKGEKGMPGRKGEVGTLGQTRVKGDKGIKGDKFNPDYCAGYPGLTGQPGLEGLVGPVGAIGEVGDKGEPTNLYKGKPGTPGLSIKGQKGDNGDKGDKGLIGSSGVDGMWGDDGDAFIDIRFGSGDNCVTCTPGQPGLPGLRGPPGLPGPNGQDPDTVVEIEVTTEPNRLDW